MSEELTKKIKSLNEDNTLFSNLNIAEENGDIAFYFSFRMDTYVLKAEKKEESYLFGQEIAFNSKAGDGVMEHNRYRIEDVDLKEMSLDNVLSNVIDIYSKISLSSVVRHFREMHTSGLMSRKDAALEIVDNYKSKFKKINIKFDGKDFKYKNNSGKNIELLLNSERGLLINDNKKTKTPSVIENKVDIFSSIESFLSEITKEECKLRLNPSKKNKKRFNLWKR